MNYKKKYMEALERMKSWARGEHPECFTEAQKAAEFIFPELKESEDERIKKVLINYFNRYKEQDTCGSETFNGIPTDNVLAWLEKQGEQPKQDNSYVNDYNSIDPHFGKPIDKVEPKFPNGQWIVWKDKCYKVNDNGCGYELVDQNGLSTSLEYGTIDENAHIWDITKDAKDGDVLAADLFEDTHTNSFVAIYESRGLNFFTSHCFVGFVGNFDKDGTTHSLINIHPATKEQRDLLFQKMKDAGYEWDAEKKELKKIEQSKLTEFEDDVKGMMDAYRDAIGDNDATTEEVKKHAAYLLSLIPHKPVEWSEEDESILQGIWDEILANKHNAKECEWKTYDKFLDWLESLRPQKQWKPSEEQIKALHDLNLTGNLSYAGQGQTLIELYNDLKEL